MIDVSFLFVIAVIALIIIYYIFSSRRLFTYQKQQHKDSTVLTITAKKNLSRISVTAHFDGEEISFERKRIRKGQSVDFSYPSSDKKAKITAESESGAVQSREI